MKTTLHGSCLCGAVTYQVSEPFLNFVHCHCSRCRKATGSAHASNLQVTPDQFSWTSGQEKTVHFDLPDAESFATTFCSRCGSPLPHPGFGQIVIVPAGSLDTNPTSEPSAHVYWDSRSGWTCGERELPRFAGADWAEAE